MLDSKDAAKKLAALFPELTYGELLQKLQSDERFVWIKRGITPKQEYQVQMLGLPGLDYRHDETRIYPYGPAAVHVVGFSDIDGKGMAGIERSFNNVLSQGGKPLQLSVDMRIQHIMRRELGQAIEDFNGIGGCGIVMDVHTGEILSLVSLPDFDPHDAGNAPQEARFNRDTLGVYEMGSTFKVFTTAMALDSGKVKMTDSFNVAPYHVGKFTIHDFEHTKPYLTVPEIFAYSSNIGSLQEALVVGTDEQRRFLASLGLTPASPIEIPEIGHPIAPNPWTRVNTMTIGFGHGMSVSPIQLATGISAIINGGILHKPTLIKQQPDDVQPGTRVISAETSDLMKRLMRLQVVEGTGKNANVAGYLVGGKTGTAEKVLNGHYGKKALLSSFVGVFPMTDPKYLVMAMVDEPKPNAHSAGFATGGWVSAPAVGRRHLAGGSAGKPRSARRAIPCGHRSHGAVQRGRGAQSLDEDGMIATSKTSSRAEPEITGLTADSRQVKPGYLFAALPGVKSDGRQYIAQAVRNGAAAVLVPSGTVIDPVLGHIAVIESAEPRRSFALLGCAILSNAARNHRRGHRHQRQEFDSTTSPASCGLRWASRPPRSAPPASARRVTTAMAR